MMPTGVGARAVAAGLLLLALPAVAAPPEDTDGAPREAEDVMQVVGRREAPGRVDAGRAVETVDRDDLDVLQPRSAPEALRLLGGVSVQQTAAGQASPYIRGRTGQHTLLMFDGLRINHALFRQGPNQYFFTVDSRTIDHIDVVRGSASVELGADALAGAVWVHPLEPTIDPTRTGLRISPRAAARATTADDELGGRFQLDTQLGDSTGLLAGVGYRTVGKLEAAGPIEPLLDEDEVGVPLFEKEVPTFADDGRTQLGTGFDELTGDLRLVHRLGSTDRLVLAGYLYRQFDAPRTDQCPAPEAPLNECLEFEEQFRTQVYAKAELTPGFAALNLLTATAGYQRQHERRRLARVGPLSVGAINGGRDDIDIWSARVDAETAGIDLLDGLRLRVAYGADGSHESVDSAAWTTLVRLDITRVASRGQYLNGSTFVQGGAFVAPRLEIGRDWSLRTGGRVAAASVEAPADSESETRAVDQTWVTGVGNAGLSWRGVDGLEVLLNVEQGFRPPNLDDLTARQPTGRGFQLENPDLEPERSLTGELGLRWRWRGVRAEAWAYQMWLFDLMERRPADCPQSDRECRANRAATQLQNLPGEAVVRGAEANLRLRPGLGLEANVAVAYAWGEGPSPVKGQDERLPLSRIPPLSGHVDLGWQHAATGLYAGGQVRWAADQTRLSVGDEGDARIPFGGTPGYVVADLRGGLRVGRQLMLNVVLENLTDAPWRVHGSSVNGPGRGLVVNLEVEPWFDE